jgi:hypothetical protein
MEISADPPADREGGIAERLFTALEATPVDDTPELRSVTCPSWLEASRDVPLRARGVVSVTLQSDAGEMAEIRHRVDMELAPGTRSPILAWDAPATVDARDGGTITCKVRFTPS